MVTQNIFFKTAKFIAKDLILDILYWPIWWYSGGVVRAWQRMIDTIKQGNDELALLVWMKNIFRPMFGDYSFQGRLISFFMRVIQIIGRGIFFLFWVAFAFLWFLVWLALPLFILAQLLISLGLVKLL